jgi:hypothetical protein
MKKPSFRLWFVVGVMLALSVTYWAGCSKSPSEPTAQETVLSPTSSQALAAMAVQDRYTDNMLAHPEVVGTATGLTEDGKPAIVVLTKSDISTKADVKIESLKKGVAPVGIPAAIENLPVVVIVTGEIKALQGGFDPTDRHRPAPNGVSIGHPAITAGTLGCLVRRGSTIYILSNNHVMANSNNANIGDNILQPGDFDGGQDPADRIADLSAFKAIVFSTSANNVIDAAIADVVNDNDVTGATHPSAGSYGQPRTSTISASVNMRVQKYGRTTRHTQGRVQAINATVNVGYGSSGTARFIRQIIINPGGFSAGGDSGSLIVVRGGSNDRRPVGLLFAGSSSITIANPINDVLSNFGVTVVGD